MGRKTARHSIRARRNGQTPRAGRAANTGTSPVRASDARTDGPTRANGVVSASTSTRQSVSPAANVSPDASAGNTSASRNGSTSASRNDNGNGKPATTNASSSSLNGSGGDASALATAPASKLVPATRATAVLDRASAPATPATAEPRTATTASAAVAPWPRRSPREWPREVWTWLRGLTPETWVWIGILTLAAVLRFWGLGDKPLHHDESMHAYFSLQFAMDPASYEYDPLLHGPFQFHAEGLVFAVIIGLSTIFHVASPAGNPWINDTTARLLPATTGLVLVALTFGLRRPLGRIGAPIAAFLLAISPTFVYFSRFLREDIYFACFIYATVVCAVQYAYKRTTRWLIATTIAFVLAYATKEAIYLNIAIWGGFLAILVVWELGHVVADRLPREFSERQRFFFGHTGPLLLLGALGSAVAAVALHYLNVIARAINADTPKTDIQVAQLENTSVSIILWASIALALLVIGVLIWQIYHDVRPGADGTDLAEVTSLDGASARPGFVSNFFADLRARIDPQTQPFIALIVNTSWVNWFVAFVAGWVLFVGLYWVVPGAEHNITGFAQGFQVGVGRGIWQGLYYWIQQQQIARGGQPWYYYLLLIPLYEQLAVVFGLAGIVRCLLRPTRFRIFLIYWFVVSLALYSWAGEKMPWLTLHILLPLLLLSAVALDWVVRTVWSGIEMLARNGTPLAALSNGARVRLAGGVLGLTAALVLLIPMTYGMIVLSHKDAANGPHEMMVYVQTTPDVQLAMSKINRADQLMYGGKHQLKIGVDAGEVWPMYWYLRDYWMLPHPSQYVNFNYDVNAKATPGTTLPQEDVLFLTDEDAAIFMAQHPTGYSARTYSLRSWWDEGYKPLPCIATRTNPCPQSAQWGAGVGLGNWLTYGDNVPANPHFQLNVATKRLWNWLWYRTPLGSDQGSYNFVLVVRNGVPIQP